MNRKDKGQSSFGIDLSDELRAGDKESRDLQPVDLDGFTPEELRRLLQETHARLSGIERQNMQLRRLLAQQPGETEKQ